MMNKPRIFLFHHAGGDKYSYNAYKSSLQPQVEVYNVELPGRGDRFGETLINNIFEGAEDIYGQIKNDLNDNYYFLGNSMGGMIALLIVDRLRKENRTLPRHLFLASRKSPEAYADLESTSNADSATFWQIVEKYGGIPEALKQSEELKELYEPIIRADFKALESYGSISMEPLSLPVTIMNGLKDQMIKSEELQSWNNYFSSDVEYLEFEGGHFFLFEQMEEVLPAILSKIK